MAKLDDFLDRMLFGVATRVSGRTVAAIALLLYAGVGLLLPLSLDWPVPYLVSANVVGTSLAASPRARRFVRLKLVHMEDGLHERVVGQDEAIEAVSDAVRRARAGLKDPAGHLVAAASELSRGSRELVATNPAPIAKHRWCSIARRAVGGSGALREVAQANAI